MILVLLTVLIIVFYKFFLNLIRFMQVKKYLDEYIIWLNTGESSIDLFEHQPKIRDLVIKAGKGDVRVPIVQPLGYGQLASFNADPFLAFPNRLEDLVMATIHTLKACIGIYRSRCLETFNPFYWINLIIFLPKSIFQYLGFEQNTVLVKLLNLLWWLLSTIFTGVIIKENSKQINDIFKNLF